MLERITDRRYRRLAGVVALLPFVAAAPSLMAQGRGELKGTVTDSTGAPVAFAVVTTTSADNGYVLPTVTGIDGTYRVSVPPGNYTVTFESTGYEKVEFPYDRVVTPWAVIQNCRLVAEDEAAGDSPDEQKTPQNPSAGSQEPSLEDLGINPTQAKGNAQTQALLDKRSHMLKIHQKLGLITIEPLAVTLITSAFAGGRKTSNTDRDLHAIFGSATVGLYCATAYFAIRAPKLPGSKSRGPIRLHKALAWIHGPGMVLTPVLGEMAFAQKNRGEKVHGIASLHGPVAIVTAGAFGLAVASVSFKF